MAFPRYNWEIKTFSNQDETPTGQRTGSESTSRD